MTYEVRANCQNSRCGTKVFTVLRKQIDKVGELPRLFSGRQGQFSSTLSHELHGIYRRHGRITVPETH